jgi:arylsulfatase A-like enzyme
MLGLAHRGFRLNDYRQHIVHTLRGVGYVSVLIGSQHIASPPYSSQDEIGYDKLLPAELTSEGVSQAACKFLSGQPDQPFFLAIGFRETHRPFPSEEPTDDPRYTLPPSPVPDTSVTRQDMANFKTTVRQFDENVGEIMESLDASGLTDNTLVICTTDHGAAFPGMKCNLTDQGTGVMLLMRGAEGFTGGRVIDAMVSHIDVFPTVCELIGVDRPPWLEGESVIPLVTGRAEEIHEAVFSEITYHASYDPQRSVRTKRWKYIRRFGQRNTPVVTNIDDSPSKDLWVSSGWGDRTVPAERLYDLIFDPNEGRNLAGDPAHEPILEEMRQRLERWMKDTDDPLLEGDVPAPSGAKINDPDGISANEPPQVIE